MHKVLPAMVKPNCELTKTRKSVNISHEIWTCMTNVIGQALNSFELKSWTAYQCAHFQQKPMYQCKCMHVSAHAQRNMHPHTCIVCAQCLHSALSLQVACLAAPWQIRCHLHGQSLHRPERYWCSAGRCLSECRILGTRKNPSSALSLLRNMSCPFDDYYASSQEIRCLRPQHVTLTINTSITSQVLTGTLRFIVLQNIQAIPDRLK